jgi:uncharacterized membrane protein YdjX (TVP38/TMEM64 family)
MAKSKKIKLFIGLFYISAVGLFLYFIFTKFSFQEITSYEFIKNNRDYFYDLRQTNLFLLGVSFILFSILWVFAAGFGSPLALFAGFIFGKWFGLLFTVIGLSIGATLLYIFANYFLKEIIRDRFLNRFQKLGEKFQKSEFLYLLVYRFIGGIPFQIQNVLPCIFNVKVYNYFWSTFLGMIPSLFIVISIGSGLEEIIDQNFKCAQYDRFSNNHTSIYIPVIAFFTLLSITIFLKNIFYKK